MYDTPNILHLKQLRNALILNKYESDDAIKETDLLTNFLSLSLTY